MEPHTILKNSTDAFGGGDGLCKSDQVAELVIFIIISLVAVCGEFIFSINETIHIATATLLS